MAKVLLGVTGSVAAIYTPDLFAALEQAGHQVRVVATLAATYFFDPAALHSVAGKRNPQVVSLDADEWPGERYRRGDPVLHIELRRWADVLCIAPLDANTLAKMALGLTDNCLTCLVRAWDRTRPVVLAPAMNTLMWEHPATARHLAQVAADLGTAPPEGLPWTELSNWIAEHHPVLRIASPVQKRLACEDVGMGAMASREELLALVDGSPRRE